jgi:hypothetical protein
MSDKTGNAIMHFLKAGTDSGAGRHDIGGIDCVTDRSTLETPVWN